MSDGYSWEVYCLEDEPGGKVRYVGVSCDASRRFKQHRREARRGGMSGVHRWLRECWELQAEGCRLEPCCRILERGVGIQEAGMAERKWLQYWRDLSQSKGNTHPILNEGIGGEFLNNVDAFKQSLAYRPPNTKEQP